MAEGQRLQGAITTPTEFANRVDFNNWIGRRGHARIACLVQMIKEGRLDAHDLELVRRHVALNG